jgi:hypothetical protein
MPQDGPDEDTSALSTYVEHLAQVGQELWDPERGDPAVAFFVKAYKAEMRALLGADAEGILERAASGGRAAQQAVEAAEDQTATRIVDRMQTDEVLLAAWRALLRRSIALDLALGGVPPEGV